MIKELLDKARRSERPRNPQRAAVADLYGCDRRTWYRRNGYVEPAHSEATLRKFDLGHAVEAQVAKRLGDLGVYAERDTLVALGIDQSGEMHARQIVCHCIPDWDCNCGENLSYEEMTGHPDLWMPYGEDRVGAWHAPSALIEIKSTDVRTVAPVVSPHYALQAAAYALALGAQRAVVHVTHVVPFEKPEVEYEIDHEALRPRVVERLHEVMDRTYPGAPIPAPVPPRESAAFACKYCPFAQCPSNANKEAVYIAGPEIPA